MNKKIAIRADGSDQIGIGHITRCMHFIENLRKSYHVVFFFKRNPLIKEFLASNNYFTHELDPDFIVEEEIEEILKNSSELLILDVRDQNDDYYKKYNEKFNKVLRFDDSDKSISIYSDLYLNYNLYAEDIDFNLINKECELFLGPDYYILNPLFKKYKNYKKKIKKKAENILITMGGGDPKNLTIKIINAIVDKGSINLNIILGNLYENFEEIRDLQKKFPKKISIYTNISNMPEMMARNDLIICTGGNTSFEAVYMGIPGVLINQIHLQALNAKKFEERNIFMNGGLGENLREEDIYKMILSIIESKELRNEFIENGKKLIQQGGIKTVIEKFIN